jgi:hypothetical protein
VAYENNLRYQFFSKEKNLVLKLGGSQQFENNQFSWLVLASPISKFSIFFLEIKKKIGQNNRL